MTRSSATPASNGPWQLDSIARDNQVLSVSLALYVLCLLGSLWAVNHHFRRGRAGKIELTTSKKLCFFGLVLLFVLRIALFIALRVAAVGCWDFVNVNPYCLSPFRLSVVGHVMEMLILFAVLFNFLINTNNVVQKQRLVGMLIMTFSVLYVVGVVLVIVVPRILDEHKGTSVSRSLNLYLGIFSLVASALFLGLGICVVSRLRTLAQIHVGSMQRTKLLSRTWKRAGAGIVLAAALYIMRWSLAIALPQTWKKFTDDKSPNDDDEFVDLWSSSRFGAVCLSYWLPDIIPSFVYMLLMWGRPKRRRVGSGLALSQSFMAHISTDPESRQNSSLEDPLLDPQLYVPDFNIDTTKLGFPVVSASPRGSSPISTRLSPTVRRSFNGSVSQRSDLAASPTAEDGASHAAGRERRTQTMVDISTDNINEQEPVRGRLASTLVSLNPLASATEGGFDAAGVDPLMQVAISVSITDIVESRVRQVFDAMGSGGTSRRPSSGTDGGRGSGSTTEHTPFMLVVQLFQHDNETGQYTFAGETEAITSADTYEFKTVLCVHARRLHALFAAAATYTNVNLEWRVVAIQRKKMRALDSAGSMRSSEGNRNRRADSSGRTSSRGQSNPGSAATRPSGTASDAGSHKANAHVLGSVRIVLNGLLGRAVTGWGVGTRLPREARKWGERGVARAIKPPGTLSINRARLGNLLLTVEGVRLVPEICTVPASNASELLMYPTQSMSRKYRFPAVVGHRLFAEEELYESQCTFDVPRAALDLFAEAYRHKLGLAEKKLKETVTKWRVQPAASVDHSPSGSPASNVRSLGTGSGAGDVSSSGERRAIGGTHDRRNASTVDTVVGISMESAFNTLQVENDHRSTEAFIQERVNSCERQLRTLQAASRIVEKRQLHDVHSGRTCTFKPSTAKSQTDGVEFFATNLHEQSMKASLQGSDEFDATRAMFGLRTTNEGCNIENAVIFDSITVGAPAAHCHGFHGGGIRQLQVQLQERTKQFESLPSGGTASVARVSRANALTRQMDELRWRIAVRWDCSLMQALSALCSCFTRRLHLILAVARPEEGEHLLSMMENVGFLVQWESLLSTHGNELGMLGDMSAVIHDLRRFSFRIVPATDGVAYPHVTRVRPLPGASQQAEAKPAGEKFRERAFKRACSEVGYSPLLDEYAGGSLQKQYVIDVAVACRVGKAMLSTALQRGHLIKVFPVLLTQGINEFQTVANLKGATQLQDEINQVGVALLSEYVDRLKQSFPASSSESAEAAPREPESRNLNNASSIHRSSLSSDNSSDSRSSGVGSGSDLSSRDKYGTDSAAGVSQAYGMDDDDEMGEWCERYTTRGTRAAFRGKSQMSTASTPALFEYKETQNRFMAISTVETYVQRLFEQVRKKKHDKNVELLQLGWFITRAAGGGRICMCKSAKDRTSMSVTLEQSIWLHEFSGLASHAKSSSTAVMRSHGVRRQNALKNTLKATYAFNAIQQRFLPDAYKPPAGAGGRNIT